MLNESNLIFTAIVLYSSKVVFRLYCCAKVGANDPYWPLLFLTAGIPEIIRRCGNKPRRKDPGGQILRTRGETQHARIRTAISLWRLLRICKTEGAREPEHHLDRRMYCTEE